MTGANLFALAAASLSFTPDLLLCRAKTTTATIKSASKDRHPMTIPAIAPPERLLLGILLGIAEFVGTLEASPEAALLGASVWVALGVALEVIELAGLAVEVSRNHSVMLE